MRTAERLRHVRMCKELEFKQATHASKCKEADLALKASLPPCTHSLLVRIGLRDVYDHNRCAVLIHGGDLCAGAHWRCGEQGTLGGGEVRK